MISFVCLSELSGANAMHFLERLELLPQDHRIRLAQFIAKQCLMVVVTTPDLDSAYRIFSTRFSAAHKIINNFGL